MTIKTSNLYGYHASFETAIAQGDNTPIRVEIDRSRSGKTELRFKTGKMRLLEITIDLETVASEFAELFNRALYYEFPPKPEDDNDDG